jgi:nitroreductase
MNVKTAIDLRRAYRALQKVDISQDMIDILSKAASLAPSCFNYQPWRFVFVYEKEMLEKVFSSLSSGNQIWASKASMIIVAFAKKEDDCVIIQNDYEREYYLFDVGQAVAFLILQATELDLVAHPIAGYNPKQVHEILSIPSNYTIITLIIVGKKNENTQYLSEKQRKTELERPVRLSYNKTVFHNRFTEN